MTTRLPDPHYTTNFGAAYLGDALDLLKHVKDESVDLIMTSPPFGLRRKKEYGNVDAENYVKWFLPFSLEFYRVLKHEGSLVIDIGGAWNPGHPTKSLYNFELVVTLCNQVGFHLAQDFYWFNPARLPAPAEWVTVRRIRAKDAVDTIWWLSKSPFRKDSNRSPLKAYSESMFRLFRRGLIAAVPRSTPGLIPIPQRHLVEFLRLCHKAGLRPDPTRHPRQLSGLVVMLSTDETDLLLSELCACQEAGLFNCGMLGVLAGLPQENGRRYLERCDTCQRYDSDEAACEAYAQVMGGRCSYDPEDSVIWIPA